MTPDDIIRMANEAGVGMDAQHPGWLLPHLERFARLVAAAEREACARVAEEWLGPTKDRELHIANAIRARGEQ